MTVAGVPAQISLAGGTQNCRHISVKQQTASCAQIMAVLATHLLVNWQTDSIAKSREAEATFANKASVSLF